MKYDHYSRVSATRRDTHTLAFDYSSNPFIWHACIHACIQVITVNGAVIVRRDIEYGANGGGVLHVLDRVMYPPTVGDVVQTLKSDPERRFSTLVKALKTTGLDREISDYSSKSS